MFLTKKSAKKIRVMFIIACVLTAILLAFALFLNYIEMNAGFVYALAALCAVTAALAIPVGRYSEGCAKLVESGVKTLRTELQPAEFMRVWNSTVKNPDIVERKPNVGVYSYAVLACSFMGDNKSALQLANELLSSCKKGKNNFAARTMKASVLYDCGNIEEAEKLFDELKSENVKSGQMADVMSAIENGDRAFAIGDYKTAEDYWESLLIRNFPKPDPATKLSAHHALALICEKTERDAEAAIHYNFCAEYGGKTAFASEARKKLSQ